MSRALEMRNKYDHTTPSSSFVKYDIYEQERTKLMPVSSTVTPQRSAESAHGKDDTIVDTSKSSSDFIEYYHRPEYVQSTTTTTYKTPPGYGSYKDLDSSNSDYSHQFSSGYDSFNTLNHINYENHKSISNALNRMVGYPSKEEVYDYIERAVKKYMRELETGGKLRSLAGAPSAHAEIKTYYRFPSSTVASPVASTKLLSTGTHSEFFKPAKGAYLKDSYGVIKPFTVDTYSPEGVDLTVRSKQRPKPIDLSALDVGQSWSHSSGSESGSYRKPHKSKLHVNSQTYHDINAMTYLPNRGIAYDDQSLYSTSSTYPDLTNPHSNVKDHPVGASISFGSHNIQDSLDDNKHFVPSIQMINGIPVSNPYKLNMETLK